MTWTLPWVPGQQAPGALVHWVLYVRHMLGDGPFSEDLPHYVSVRCGCGFWNPNGLPPLLVADITCLACLAMGP